MSRNNVKTYFKETYILPTITFDTTPKVHCFINLLCIPVTIILIKDRYHKSCTHKRGPYYPPVITFQTTVRRPFQCNIPHLAPKVHCFEPLEILVGSLECGFCSPCRVPTLPKINLTFDINLTFLFR